MDSGFITLPGLDLARMADPIAAFVFAMLRIGAFLLASPVFGGRLVPLPIRIMATVCLTLPVATTPGLPTAETIANLSSVPMILAELVLGLVAGLVLTILFAAAGMAGDRIANAAGLGFAMQVDPSAGGQSPVIAQLFNLVMLMVFIGTDGHLAAIRIVLDSYVAVPPGQTPPISQLVGAGLMAGGAMFALAASLMLPVVAGLLILNLAVGIVTRSAPQLNLFSIGFSLAILAALILLWLTSPQMLDGLQRIVATGFDLLDPLLNPAEVR